MAHPIQNAVSKVAGKTAAVEARFKGLKGVFVTLAEQHGEVGVLLSRAQSTDDFTKRGELWREIRRELISHEQGELLEIYPLLEGYLSTRDIGRRHGDHASDLEASIREVDAIEVRSGAWQPALTRLIAKVKEHVEKEENDFFPRAQQALGDDAVKALEKPFLRAKEMAAKEFG